ncbi:hypothetical protein A2U01_0076016 [Trifolium medium]|uniref:Uncharacterized protein n=1 Tax=Trifolium medium TaxID=97028 RepID=A0A392T3N3_9FABA|nr:hypothetical protein [Trifolium medium]
MQLAHDAQVSGAPCAETGFRSAICAPCAGFWRTVRNWRTMRRFWAHHAQLSGQQSTCVDFR